MNISVQLLGPGYHNASPGMLVMGGIHVQGSACGTTAALAFQCRNPALPRGDEATSQAHTASPQGRTRAVTLALQTSSPRQGCSLAALLRPPRAALAHHPWLSAWLRLHPQPPGGGRAAASSLLC